MSDDSFLSAILAAPDDDLPRMIYADWLDERGDPDRAEFIRTQIELARLPRNAPGRRPLRAQAAELLRRHRSAWLAPLPRLPEVRFNGFERGFPGRVVTTEPSFLLFAEAIFRAAPVRRLKVQTFFQRSWAAERLTVSPHLARVRDLDLMLTRLADEGAEALAASPHVTGLERLNVSFNLLTDVGARTLAEAAGLEGLKALDARGNRIGSDGKRALVRRFGARVSV